MSAGRLRGYFRDQAGLLAAVAELRGAGAVVADVFCPFPVAGLSRAMGLKPSRLGVVGFGVGMTAALGTLFFEIWVAAVDWPLNIGGRPDNSLPAFIPAAFEIGILCAALSMVAALFWRNRLFPGKKDPIAGSGANEDRFVVLVDAGANGERAAEIMKSHHAEKVEEHMEAEP